MTNFSNNLDVAKAAIAPLVRVQVGSTPTIQTNLKYAVHVWLRPSFCTRRWLRVGGSIPLQPRQSPRSSMVECFVWNEEVIGSSPIAVTKFNDVNATIAQLVSAAAR